MTVHRCFKVTGHNFFLQRPLLPCHTGGSCCICCFERHLGKCAHLKCISSRNCLLVMHVYVGCDYVGRWKVLFACYLHLPTQSLSNDDTQKKEAAKAERDRERYRVTICSWECVPLFRCWGQCFPSDSLHSCWRTSQTSWGLTSPCTWIKSCWSCRSLSRPAGAACAPSPSSSRPASQLLGSSSSAKETPSRLSTLSAQAPWKYWRTTLCWPFWVKSTRV